MGNTFRKLFDIFGNREMRVVMLGEPGRSAARQLSDCADARRWAATRRPTWRFLQLGSHSLCSEPLVAPAQVQAARPPAHRVRRCLRARRLASLCPTVGLDAAGKTTILYKLHIGEVLSTVPTIGFNVEKAGSCLGDCAATAAACGPHCSFSGCLVVCAGGAHWCTGGYMWRCCHQRVLPGHAHAACLLRAVTSLPGWRRGCCLPQGLLPRLTGPSRRLEAAPSRILSLHPSAHAQGLCRLELQHPTNIQAAAALAAAPRACCAQVQYKNVVFTVWDVGGQEKLRPLWRHYFNNTDALIYVVDCCDRERVGRAAAEFKVRAGLGLWHVHVMWAHVCVHACVCGRMCMQKAGLCGSRAGHWGLACWETASMASS